MSGLRYEYYSLMSGRLRYYSNGDLNVHNTKVSKTFTKEEMQAASDEYKGVNRIHKPIALLFWTDCKNGNTNKWFN